MNVEVINNVQENRNVVELFANDILVKVRIFNFLVKDINDPK